jgi:hypothetical protein
MDSAWAQRKLEVRKMLENAQNLQRPVLGMDLKTRLSATVRTHAIINDFSHFRQTKLDLKNEKPKTENVKYM